MHRLSAATGMVTYELDGHVLPAVLKIPVVPRELRWLRRLQDAPEGALVVPRVFASGASIDEYDLAWVVMERFAHGPLGSHWDDGHVARIADAAAWSAVVPLSCDSVARRSTSVDVPDFTRGAWRDNTPLGIVDVDPSRLPLAALAKAGEQLDVR